jgi:hypothetical protein
MCAIDDRQAPNAEADLRGDELSGIVRAAMDKGVGHATNETPEFGRWNWNRRQQACYAAHVWILIVTERF